MPISIIGKVLSWTGLPQWGLELIFVGILAGAGMWGIHHLESIGAKKELSKLQESSNILVSNKNKEIAKLTKNYADAQVSNKEQMDAANKTIADLKSSNAQRLREYYAYRRSHPGVQSPSGGSGSTPAGESDNQGSPDPVEQLGNISNDLADSTRKLIIVLQGCQRDRDAVKSK